MIINKEKKNTGISQKVMQSGKSTEINQTETIITMWEKCSLFFGDLRVVSKNIWKQL